MGLVVCVGLALWPGRQFDAVIGLLVLPLIVGSMNGIELVCRRKTASGLLLLAAVATLLISLYFGLPS